MTHLRGWGLLLAICTPLLILFSWNRLGNESSRINLERYADWSAVNVVPLLLRPLMQHYEAHKKLAGPGDLALPPVPKNSGAKSWSIQPDAVLRVELDAKDGGRPLVLKYVPVVRSANAVYYECVSGASPIKVGRVCGSDSLRSEADIPAQLQANERVLQGLPPLVTASGDALAATATAGSVVVAPENVADLEHCGYQCVKRQSCVTPRPLACGRLVAEGAMHYFSITATPESYRGSSFATRADADKACEAADAGATVLRASSISGRFKLAGGREYWVHDEMRTGNNCWRN